MFSLLNHFLRNSPKNVHIHFSVQSIIKVCSEHWTYENCKSRIVFPLEFKWCITFPLFVLLFPKSKIMYSGQLISIFLQFPPFYVNKAKLDNFSTKQKTTYIYIIIFLTFRTMYDVKPFLCPLIKEEYTPWNLQKV